MHFDGHLGEKGGVKYDLLVEPILRRWALTQGFSDGTLISFFGSYIRKS